MIEKKDEETVDSDSMNESLETELIIKPINMVDFLDILSKLRL